MNRRHLATTLLLVLVACGSGGGSDTPDAKTVDVPQAADLAAEVPADDVAFADAPADAPSDTPADTPTDAPWTPPFDPVVCGGDPYAWLPPGGMGAIVSFEPADLFPELPAETINALLAQSGFATIGTVPYGARNYKLRYVTQDRGVTREATAMVAIPVGTPAGQALPAAAFLHGTTGFMDDCAPSAKATEAWIPATLMASLGYVAVAPDYLGMLGFGEKSPPGTIHPYCIAEPTAIASLDSIRALLKVVEANPDFPRADGKRVVLWGGSEGGYAALFADRYAPHYAPELELAAVVALVPPTDLQALAVYGTNHWGATGITLMAAFASMRAWYGHPADLTGVLTDDEPHHLATSVPVWLATTCKPEGDYSDVTQLSQVYLASFLASVSAGDFDAVAPWGCYLEKNGLLGSPVPRVGKAPILTGWAENDDLVITATERKSFENLCASGYRMEYFECAGLGHSEGGLAGLPYARKWTEARLRGDPWDEAKVCKVSAPVDCGAL
jgi:dienelactone hydrolase